MVTPVTTPVPMFIVATDGTLLLQVPNAGVVANAEVMPVHKLVFPVMAVGVIVTFIYTLVEIVTVPSLTFIVKESIPT